MTGTAVTEVRDRLVLALDVDDPSRALGLAETCRPWFGVAKVGVELYAAAGPSIFDALHEAELRVFADLKLHDIPTTVARAARVLGRRGVDFCNFHAAGGVEMLRRGADELRAGAAQAGHGAPVALAVTVLTSDSDTAAFPGRLQAACTAGCEGVVCSAYEVSLVAAAGLRSMVPGIRPASAAPDDQVRVATPRAAMAAGAQWLVVGRPVTRATDPAAAAATIAREAAEGLATRTPGP